MNKINITNNAWKKIASIIQNSNSAGLLFSAKGGGCNGFNYNLKLMNKQTFKNIQNNKTTIIEKNKIKVIIDPISELYLLGTTVDYVNESIENNIFESKFTFKPNKNITDICGCGISFTPKTIKMSST